MCFPTVIVSGRSREKVSYKLYLIKTFNYFFFGTKSSIFILTYSQLINQNKIIFFQVYSFVKLTELYYAGSHGMDIKGPEQNSKYKKV